MTAQFIVGSNAQRIALRLSGEKGSSPELIEHLSNTGVYTRKEKLCKLIFQMHCFLFLISVVLVEYVNMIEWEQSVRK